MLSRRRRAPDFVAARIVALVESDAALVIVVQRRAERLRFAPAIGMHEPYLATTDEVRPWLAPQRGTRDRRGFCDHRAGQCRGDETAIGKRAEVIGDGPADLCLGRHPVRAAVGVGCAAAGGRGVDGRLRRGRRGERGQGEQRQQQPRQDSRQGQGHQAHRRHGVASLRWPAYPPMNARTDNAAPAHAAAGAVSSSTCGCGVRRLTRPAAAGPGPAPAVHAANRPARAATGHFPDSSPGASARPARRRAGPVRRCAR